VGKRPRKAFRGGRDAGWRSVRRPRDAMIDAMIDALAIMTGAAEALPG
jgi:hypothetical protein